MKLEDLIKEYKHIELIRPVNFLKIPVNTLDFTEEGISKYNEIVKLVKSMELNNIIRTRSRAISRKTILPAYDISNSNICVELTLLVVGGMFRFQIRNTSLNNNETGLSGRQAFKKFKNIAKSYNITMEDYIATDGAKIKETIEKPIIRVENNAFLNKTFYNVHHIDFHSSYPAGLINTHPEFKEMIQKLYDKRKTNSEYKFILNSSIGCMQSISVCGAKYAQLAKDAIHDNNKRLLELSDRLRNSGRVILSYNTDGIWYLGDIYHGDGEGKNIGQWDNDHINTTWRAKSNGAYEFIENGVYYPVLRGRSSYDKIKPRIEWEWGDIYKGNLLMFILGDDGFIRQKESIEA